MVYGTCNTSLSSNACADGLPSSVENAIFPPVIGEISENSCKITSMYPRPEHATHKIDFDAKPTDLCALSDGFVTRKNRGFVG